MNKSAQYHAQKSRTQRHVFNETYTGKPARKSKGQLIVLSERLKPRTAAELANHAYQHEVARVEHAIFWLEGLSGPRTIPLLAGMALDDAILALYKAKGAFDAFSHDER